MNLVSELLNNTLHTSTTSLVGVGGIFLYFTVLFVMAIYRITQNLKSDHH